MLVDGPLAKNGQVVILQPRRLAARMLAARVAQERGCRLGEEVGYQIRFEKKASESTRILFVTEGILLRRMLAAPMLDGVAAVILDEFHERHLYGDISLAKCLDLQESGREDLKLLVMSATLDGSQLMSYLGDSARLLRSEGRTFPVSVSYLQKNAGEVPAWELAARSVAAEFPKTAGHALVFMPGAYEIRKTAEALRNALGQKIPVLPLHGEMPVEEQDRAVLPTPEKKVIVATNVAETSLTIDGVTLVVDSGLARFARYDAARGIDTLLIEKISQASAEQRAGRAGRTSPGKCLRLWTINDHERRQAKEVPEILRMDLAETVLTLKASGVEDLDRFRWIDPPDPLALLKAVRLLKDLGALAQGGNAITEMGRRMLSFPVHPRYSRLFLEAQKHGCMAAAASLAALTQSKTILVRNDRAGAERLASECGDGTSDFILLLKAQALAKKENFRVDVCKWYGIHAGAARAAETLAGQFLKIAEREGMETETGEVSEEALSKCVLAAFSDQVAKRRSAGNYQFDFVHGRRGILPKTSLAAAAQWIVAGEIQEIGKGIGNAEVQVGLAAEIRREWLEDLFPEDFGEARQTLFDPEQGRVVVRSETVFRDLVFAKSDKDAKPGREAAACLARVVKERGIELQGWGEAGEQWIRRVNFLSSALPELGISAIDSEDRQLLLEQFCEDATCLRDIKTKDARPILRAWLRPDQVAVVDRMAPERLVLPGGKSAKILYGDNGDARVAVRIQELFGLTQGLKIAGGKIPLTIEVLAPNHRPVQVTRDLENFWKTTYQEIKPALQRRYPKHRWE